MSADTTGRAADAHQPTGARQPTGTHDSEPGSPPQPAVEPLRRRAVAAAVAGTLTIAALTIPNAVLDVGFFTRGVPIRWWELPVAILAGLLVAAWFLIPAPRAPSRADKRPVVGAAALAVVAVGCPTCNAVMMLALGLTGTLRYWAPVQPLLAAACLVVLTVAAMLRWRRRRCGATTTGC